MVNFGGLGTVLLTGIVGATLQLSSGTLLLLYHASLGKHIKKQTRRLVRHYIAGFAMTVFLVMAAAGFVILSVFHELPAEALMVVIGILFALALVMWCLYYRRGDGTELWLPKKTARFIHRRAGRTNSPAEAMSLGILTFIAEWPFTLVLSAVAAYGILQLSFWWRLAAILIYVLIYTLPLLLIRAHIRQGQTIVEVQKWRVKNKTFLRFISGISFIVLAVFLIAYAVLK